LDKFKKPFVFASSQMSTMMHSNYGLLKLIGERATESLNGLTVSFWNIYGNETDENKFHVITDFIRMAHNNKEIKMQTNGEEIRDFLYVKDVVKGGLLIIEKGESMRPYNLGYGGGITIGEIVDTIIEVSELKPDVIWDDSKPTTIPFRAVSTERINTEIGFVPTYTFKQGITETINWFKGHDRL
jgi:nucleoside-diphosphate-sugar epimerase